MLRVINYISKRHLSALYITGDKAQTNFAVLTPHLDIEERMSNREVLENNLHARGLDKIINLETVENRWSFYMHLMDRRNILGFTKSEISKEIAKLMEDEEKNSEELTKLKLHSKILKDEISTLRDFMYGVEESAAEHALSLPNVLHENTPTDQEAVLYSHLEQPAMDKSKSHIEIGANENLIDCSNNLAYLLNDAALFEYAVLNYFQTNLVNSQFTLFSNADFAKSVIVEGCGAQNHETLILEEDEISLNKLHLTGGATRFGFMAYFARYNFPGTMLPLKFVSTGRKYQVVKGKQNPPSLLNLMQSSAAEICVATSDDDKLNESFEEITSKIQDFYADLGYHFRLVLLPAKQIKRFESLRLSIQMFSNFTQEYVEVGNLSICDDYLSKRLLFTYSENKERKFPKLIVGNVVDVQKMLACVIENRNGKDLISGVLKQYAL